MKLDSSAFVADKALIEALERRSSSIICENDRILFKQGDEATGLYILRAGAGRVSMISPTGDQVMSIPVPSGSLLGLPALLGNQPYSLSAMVYKGAELRHVSREDFTLLMLNEPSLSLSALRILAAEVRTARFAISAY